MNFFDWLLLAATCLVGAMSPGPSLLCVMQHAIKQGRAAGIGASIAHALGVLLWALFTVFALHSVTAFLPYAGSIISLLGAAFLIYLGIKSLRAKNKQDDDADDVVLRFSAIRDGFAVAFLNPKLAIFFTALFSQFLIFQPSVIEKLAMSCIASIIDGLWYIVVTMLVTTPRFRSRSFAKLGQVNTIAGVLFIFLGLQVVVHTITN